MIIGNKNFDVENKTYIMGILNVTPDSFSDGGKWNNMDSALKHVEKMILDGTDIVDIGGESTRPDYIKVTEDEEIERVVPYIQEIKKRFDIPISIDTYKGRVAEAAIKGGADLINDIWGFKGDDTMAKVAAKYQIPCCIMHNRNIDVNPYNNLLEDVINDLKESIKIGLSAGVKFENLITDPGIGICFGKTLNDNLMVMNNLEILHKLHCPILLGTSRKSMIGMSLELPVNERLEGTLATTVMGVMKGCAFIRVHDIKENFRAIKMTEAILDKGK